MGFSRIKKPKLDIFDDSDELPALIKQKAAKIHKMVLADAAIRKNITQLEQETKARYEFIKNKCEEICKEMNDNGSNGLVEYTESHPRVCGHHDRLNEIVKRFYFLVEKPTKWRLRITSVDDLVATCHLGSLRRYKGISNWNGNFDDVVNQLGVGEVKQFKLCHYHYCPEAVILKLKWVVLAEMDKKVTREAIVAVVGAICDANAYRLAFTELHNLVHEVVGKLTLEHAPMVAEVILNPEAPWNHPSLWLRVLEMFLQHGYAILYEEMCKYAPVGHTTLEARPSLLMSISQSQSSSKQPTPMEEITRLPSPQSPNVPETHPDSSEGQNKQVSSIHYPPISQLSIDLTDDWVVNDGFLHALHHISRVNLRHKMVLLSLTPYRMIPLIESKMSVAGRQATISRLIAARDLVLALKTALDNANGAPSADLSWLATGVGLASFYLLIINSELGLINSDVFYNDDK